MKIKIILLALCFNMIPQLDAMITEEESLKDTSLAIENKKVWVPVISNFLFIDTKTKTVFNEDAKLEKNASHPIIQIHQALQKRSVFGSARETLQNIDDSLSHDESLQYALGKTLQETLVWPLRMFDQSEESEEKWETFRTLYFNKVKEYFQKNSPLNLTNFTNNETHEQFLDDNAHLDPNLALDVYTALYLFIHLKMNYAQRVPHLEFSYFDRAAHKNHTIGEEEEERITKRIEAQRKRPSSSSKCNLF